MSRKDHRFTESPVLKDQLASWRIHLVSALIFGALLTLVGRAFYLQLINEDFLQERGDARYRRVLEIPASRGKILDRHGDMLAQSTPMRAVWATADAKLDKAQLKELAALLEMDPRQIEKKLNGDKNFVYLKRQVSPDAAARIAALKLPGIQMDREYSRFYPAGDMVAHMVGFTGKDDRGQEGVELAFENRLIGKPGERTVIKDRRGQIVEEVGSERPPQDGDDIELAIDSKIQFIAFNALRNAADKFNAKGGSVIVADIKTGEILALANWPTYNPNNRAQLSGGQLRNRAVTDSFEPGSTMKPFIAALALDRGKYKFDSIINCAPGKMTIGSATISDAHPYGALTLAQVIQKSSNIGATKIALGFPSEDMWTMMSKVGFGKPLGLGFPGEVGGRLRPWQTWKPIEQATMSYGHGVSVTVVQLAHAYSVFGRDGDVVPLSLLKTNGSVAGQPVFAPETSRQVRQMLEMVVSPEGTARKAAVPGYRVGGKTGTAHKLVGGRYANKYLASFVGIGPISDPRLVVGVVVDEPVGAHYGGDVAGPVFSEVMGGSLRTLGVPQDQDPAKDVTKAALSAPVTMAAAPAAKKGVH
ncbi:MAG: penicillin-binding protein 2 [Rhodocyclaceae bacterium]|nr:penicillin-binding protein 2 [Rhodocyclaceae bacterium]